MGKIENNEEPRPEGNPSRRELNPTVAEFSCGLPVARTTEEHQERQRRHNPEQVMSNPEHWLCDHRSIIIRLSAAHMRNWVFGSCSWPGCPISTASCAGDVGGLIFSLQGTSVSQMSRKVRGHLGHRYMILLTWLIRPDRMAELFPFCGRAGCFGPTRRNCRCVLDLRGLWIAAFRINPGFRS